MTAPRYELEAIGGRFPAVTTRTGRGAAQGRLSTPVYGLTGRAAVSPVLRALLEQDALELVGLAGLEDGKHLIARLQGRVPVGDLRLAVANDGDQLRAGRKRDRVDGLAD